MKVVVFWEPYPRWNVVHEDVGKMDYRKQLVNIILAMDSEVHRTGYNS